MLDELIVKQVSPDELKLEISKYVKVLEKHYKTVI